MARVKGSKNKNPIAVKELLQTTLLRLQLHPKKNMYQWAIDNPTEFYKLIVKLLPMEIVGRDGESLVQLLIQVNSDNVRKEIDKI